MKWFNRFFEKKAARGTTFAARRRQSDFDVEMLEPRLLLSAFYNFDALLQTSTALSEVSPQTVTSLSDASINNRGQVSLIAGFSGGGNAIVADATPNVVQDPEVIGFLPSTTRNFAFDQINDGGQIVARDRANGSPPRFFIRTWDIDSESFSTITDSLNSVPSTLPSIANDGGVAYIEVGGSSRLMFSSNGNAVPLDVISGTGLRPVSSDTAVLMRDRGTTDGTLQGVIRVYEEGGIFSGFTNHNLAATSSFGGLWTELGVAPSISDDGLVVAWAGKLGTSPNPGIYISYRETSGWTAPIEVAGARFGVTGQIIPELGIDPSKIVRFTDSSGHTIETGTPISMEEFDYTSRVGVVHQDLGPAGFEGDSIVVSFIGTPSADSAPLGGQSLFRKASGLWTVRVDLERDINPTPGSGFLNAHPTSPIPVIQTGDTFQGITVGSIQVGDPITNAGFDLQTGMARSLQRGDHFLTFTVTDATNASRQMVVRAEHVDSDQDGLLDHWERTGGGIDSNNDGTPELDLSRLGAKPDKRDLFLEIDWLPDRTDGGQTWSNELPAGTAEDLVAFFQKAPAVNGIDAEITLHLDAGQGNDVKGAKLSRNMGQATPAELHGGEVTITGQRPDLVYLGMPYPNNQGKYNIQNLRASAFSDIKAQNFDVLGEARALAFHYALLSDFNDLGPTGRQILTVTDFTQKVDGGLTDRITVGTTLSPNSLKDHAILVTHAADNRNVRQLGRIVSNTDHTIDIDGLANPIQKDDSFIVLAGGGRAEVAWYSRRDANERLTGTDNQGIPGNDVVIALGAYGGRSASPKADTLLLGNNFVVHRMLEHELGHTFGLRHGGKDFDEKRTDYKSLMSYTYVYVKPTRSSDVDSFSSQNDAIYYDWGNLKLDVQSQFRHLIGTSEEVLAAANTPDNVILVPDLNPLEIEQASGSRDVISPELVITAPSENAVLPVSTSLTIRGTTSDTSGVESVAITFDLDGNGFIDPISEYAVANLSPDGTYSASFGAVTGSAGSRTIHAYAHDIYGNSTHLSRVVQVTTASSNQNPVAENDGPYATTEDQLLTVPATQGVLANDHDPNSDPLSATLLAQATHGVVILANDGGFTYQPNADFNGSDSFTYTVSDGQGGTATATVSLTIAAVNDAPVLNVIGPKSVNEQSELRFTIGAADADLPAQPLTFSASGLPSGSTFNATTHEFVWTPTEAQGPGSYQVTFSVTDGVATTNEVVTITVGEVNQTPVLTPIGSRTVQVGQPLTFTLSATDGDEPANVLTFSATGLPTGATFDPTTRTFTWTPTAGQVGDKTLTFTVQDEGTPQLSDSETITISVTPQPNQNPVAQHDGPYAATEDELLTVLAAQGLLANDSDPNADPLSASLLAQATKGVVTLASDGGFTYQPNADFNGADSFTYTVSDGQGGTATATVSLTVAAVNDAPTFTKGADQTVQENAGPQSVANWATAISRGPADESGQAVSFTLTSNNPALFAVLPAVASDGGLIFTPAANASGSATVTVVLRDNGGTTNGGVDASAPQTFTITVRPANQAPVLDPIGDKTVDEGATLTFTATASDADMPKQSLTFSLAPGAPTGASIDPTTGLFTWTPTEGPGASPYSVTVQVSDGVVTTSEPIAITVKNVVPTVSVIPPGNVQEGMSATYQFQLLDPGSLDTHTIQINWGDGSAVETITSTADAHAGLTLSRNHTYADNGSYTISVSATDDEGAVGQTSAAVTVQNVGPNVSVTPATQTKQYSDPITPIVLTATDVATDTLNIATAWSTNGTSFTAGLPDELTITGGLTLTGAANQVGTASWTINGIADLDPAKTYTIRVTVSDEDGGSSVKQSVIDIDQEDARATYTGVLYASTPSATNRTATVQLSATIQDLTAVLPGTDADAGLISKATVTFVNRDTGGIIASNVPVALVNPSDPKTGTAVYNWTVTLPNNSISESYTIGVIVNGYYTRNASTDNTVVTVSLPQQDSLAGGGYLVNQSSAGTYAGDAGEKTNFGFNIKFNKQLTNLQGKATLILRDSGHVYQVKSNSTNSLTVNQVSTGVYDATVTSKANLTDITNPLAPVSLGGNLDLTMTLRDAGEPGTADQLGITLFEGSKLLYSSNWNGTQTVKQVLGGGNLQLRKSAALLAEGGALAENGSLPVLTDAQLAPIVDAAKAQWIAGGVTSEQAAALSSAHVTIANLDGVTLGQTQPALSSVEGGSNIQLDQTAAGHGWFIDATPQDNAEFHFVNGLSQWVADGHSPAAHHTDLFTVVMHELGHVLGLEDRRGQGPKGTLMMETLPEGVRRTGGIESVGVGARPSDFHSAPFPIDWMDETFDGDVVRFSLESIKTPAWVSTFLNGTNAGTQDRLDDIAVELPK